MGVGFYCCCCQVHMYNTREYKKTHPISVVRWARRLEKKGVVGLDFVRHKHVIAMYDSHACPSLKYTKRPPKAACNRLLRASSAHYSSQPAAAAPGHWRSMFGVQKYWPAQTRSIFVFSTTYAINGEVDLILRSFEAEALALIIRPSRGTNRGVLRRTYVTYV